MKLEHGKPEGFWRVGFEIALGGSFSCWSQYGIYFILKDIDAGAEEAEAISLSLWDDVVRSTVD